MDPRTESALSARRRRLAGTGLVLTGLVVMLISLVSAGAAGADPKGNNGTIKVDGVALQGGQANEPHVDCTFALEFSGYDQGDLKASIAFALQSPTRRASGSQVLLTDTLAIGEDAAGGATDLDASKEYQLDFSGVTPHPKQGFHVKVTIRADGSQGADTKHKVFWVQPCPPETTTTTTTTTSTTTMPTTVPAGPGEPESNNAVLGGEVSQTPGVQVLGEQLVRPETTLPRTGTDVAGLALLGGLALALGGLLVLLSRHGPAPARH